MVVFTRGLLCWCWLEGKLSIYVKSVMSYNTSMYSFCKDRGRRKKDRYMDDGERESLWGQLRGLVSQNQNLFRGTFKGVYNPQDDFLGFG